MEWQLVALIMGMAITVLTFLWGIIKTFKKPEMDKSWEEPLNEQKILYSAKFDSFKEYINNQRISHRKELEVKFKEIDNNLIEHTKRIHDLETHKDVMAKAMQELKEDLKGEINKVSQKCDAILDKVIEYLRKDN